MKYLSILPLFSILFFFTSCKRVYFDTIQPKGGERLTAFPAELQGKWVDELETIKLEPQQMIRILTETDSLNNMNVTEIVYALSDTIRIYKAGEYYVANLFDASKGWEILVADRNDNGDIIWYYPTKHPHFGKKLGFFGGLRLEKVDVAASIIDGTDEFFDYNKNALESHSENDIREVYYKGQFKIKHIPMIIKPENIIWKWNANGTLGDVEIFE